MKVVMINDCAFVGETLLKYMPPDMEKRHIKRTRGLWSKTFGLAYKILKAKGDVYHVHYLLQDCYMAARLGKSPLIGHAHGSDLREIVKSRKWGWIIKYNLRKCDKILVAQPTILDVAKEFNETAEYFPIPYDPNIFYEKPLPDERNIKQIFLASPHDFRVKGTDKFLRALASLDVPLKVKSIWYGRDVGLASELAKALGVRVEFVGRVPHECMNKLYWESDLVLGSFGVGQLDTVAIEAMACGRPVVHSVSKKHFPTCPLEELKTVEDPSEIFSKLLFSRKEREERVKAQINYVSTSHAAPLLAQRVVKVYSQLAGNV